MLAASLGLLLSVVAHDQTALAVLMFCLAAAGMYGYLPGFWALPTSFLTGTAAAASIGLINSFGNLGGFVGPYILGYVRTTTNSFSIGLVLLAISMVIGAACVLAVRHAAGAGQRT